MKNNKVAYPPFVREPDSVVRVMTDVLLALLPCVVIATLAYGFAPVAVILVAVGSALGTEFLFSLLISRKTVSLADGSAIVTGLLLAFTLGPFTPLPVTALGASAAILFGKLLWGGLGRNVFNPALVGRECITIFFPAIMVSEWMYTQPDLLRIREIQVFDHLFPNQLIYQPSGAMGEYSVLFLFLGGLYLLLRRRISWHIPVSVMLGFTGMLFLFSGYDLRFSLGGIFLGAIYMATDMPTSPSAPAGKIYFGGLIGVICVVCLIHDIPRGYLSYAILLMNLFVRPVNYIFCPVVWGRKKQIWKRAAMAVLLTGVIGIATWGVIVAHHADAVKYLVYGFILYTIGRFVTNRVGTGRIGK